MRVLVHLKGGHSTVLNGTDHNEVRQTVETALGEKVPFVYLGERPIVTEKGLDERFVNRICVDPRAVVGIIKVQGSKLNEPK